MIAAAGDVVARAKAAGRTVATAESCTGGLVAAALTDVPGASSVFTHGVVAYANAAKTELLGVDADLIATHGAVSDAVAGAMAAGMALLSGADAAVSVTGIAGPGGGSADKPVGLVWFGTHAGGQTRTHCEVFADEGREAIRGAATKTALRLLAAVL